MSQDDYLNSKNMLRRLFYQAKYPILWDIRSDLSTTLKESKNISEILRDLKTEFISKESPPKIKSMAKMLVYLGLTESLGVTLIDIALMLLIANGNEMHTHGPFIKHVTTHKELRKLDLAYKLDFLKKHKLEFFAKLINRELRNEIAHLKFKIDENGKIKDSKNNTVLIDDVISEFWAKYYSAINMFEDTGLKQFLEQKEVTKNG